MSNPFASGNNNIFGNNQTQGNPFQNNQQQGNNYQNTGASIFGGGQQTTNSLFGGGQQQGGNSLFGGQQQQGNTLFGQNQAGGIFGGQQQGQQGQQGGQQSNSIFGNQQQTGQGNNLFGGNQQQQGNSLFGGNTQQQGNNLFGGQQQQGNNLFGGQQQQGNNLFGGQQQQQGNNLFGQQQTNPFNQQPQQVGGSFQNNTNAFYQNQNMNNIAGIYQMSQSESFQRQMNRRQLDEHFKILSRNLAMLENFRLDERNSYKSKKVRSQADFKTAYVQITKKIKQLKTCIKEIKKQSQQTQKKMYNFTQGIRNKLKLYKECLIQSLSQNSMVDEVMKQINAMDNQIDHFFIPIFNAYRSQTYYSYTDPNEFCLTIAIDINNKIQTLNQKVDDIIACRTITATDYDSINVFEQLIEYYHNVSITFKQLVDKYNQKKRQAIQKRRRGSYDEVSRRINEKKEDGKGKSFHYYRQLKEIDAILEDRQRRERQEKKIF